LASEKNPQRLVPGDAGARQAKHFEEVGDEYLWVRRELPITRRYYEFWTSELLRRAPPVVTGWSVDGLCGGADVAYAGSVSPRWLGVDISLNLLLMPPSESPKTRVSRIAGDVTRMPVREGTLDAVYIRGALHHVPDYPLALRETLRLLRPGSRLVMSEPSDDVSLYRWMRNSVYRSCSCFDAETEKAFRKTELVQSLEDSGFRILEYRPFGYAAYMILGQTDVIRVFQKIQKLPGAMALAEFLIWIDRVSSRIPLVRHFAFANMVVAERP